MAYSLNSEPRLPLGLADRNANFVSAYRSATSRSKPTVSTPVSNKRKASAEPEEDSEDEGVLINESCDKVRRKINAFLASGVMKKGEFNDAIGSSSNAVNRFLGQNGAYKGSQSDVYINAFKFFKKREAKGIKVAKKKVKKGEEKQADIDSIKLDGEADNAVEIYDSCDEICKKIRAYMTEPGVTQAGFLREIAKTYGDGRKIQSKVLNDFLGKRGATAGNTSSVFYSSYVFFEKLRIKDGKPKSKHRLEMEGIYARGLDTKRRRDHVWLMADESASTDKYGRLQISGR